MNQKLIEEFKNREIKAKQIFVINEISKEAKKIKKCNSSFLNIDNTIYI